MAYNNNCEHPRRLIHLALDGELPEEDARLLEQHLQECVPCRREYEELGRLADALREGLVAVATPEPPVEAIRSRLAQTRRPRVAWNVWLPAAAAVLLVIGLLASRPALRGPSVQAAPAVVTSGGDAIHVFAPNATVAYPGHTGVALEEESVAWGLSGEKIEMEFAVGARVEFSDEAVVRIGHDEIDLYKGDLKADLTDAREPFTISTPWGRFSGAGSVFSVRTNVNGALARVAVIEGNVTVDWQGRDQILSRGETMVLEPDPERTVAL